MEEGRRPVAAPSGERTAKELAAICCHYLGPPFGEEDTRLVYACPGCGETTFAANLVTLKAGCWTGRCPPGRYADALELVSYFDGLPGRTEALGRAREILGPHAAQIDFPTGEGAEGADAATAAGEAGDNDPLGREESQAADEPRGREPDDTRPGTGGALDDRKAGSVDLEGLARSASEGDGGNPGGEEGWYAMLRVSGAVHKKPEIYRPGGALRPLSSSWATGAELLAALISLAAGAAGAWQLVEHTVPLMLLVGLSEAAHVLVRYEAVCAIAAGVLVSVAAWLFLSGRRRAERRHLGDSDPGRSSARRSDAGRKE